MSELSVQGLVEKIAGGDNRERANARDQAGPAGAAAIAPLAELATTAELEVARSANKAMQNIVSHVGRPGATDEARAVTGELLKLLGDDQPDQFRRDVLWMVWQIGDEAAAGPVAELLANPNLHEDARMALEELPGETAIKAMVDALTSADDHLKPGLAHSLAKRGVETSGIPDLRLKPTKQTSVQPARR